MKRVPRPASRVPRWLLVPVLLVLMVTASGEVASAHSTQVSSCTPGTTQLGTDSVCANASGLQNAQPEVPNLNCGVANNGGTGYWNVMQGCGGSGNYVRWGFSNWQGVTNYISQYGWAYSGTGQTKYLAIGTESVIMPNDSANYNVAVSDGKWDNCGNLVANCDFDPWDNYLGNWFSPTAELRLWVDGIYRGGPYSSGNWMQEYGLSAPRLGIANCIGSGAGEASVSLSATDNVQTSASYGGTVQGQVSIGYGYNYTYQVKFKYNGECGTGVPDGYSEYFNENWQGNPIGMTASPQTFDSVAGFSGGPNNSLWIDVNIVPGFTVTYANNSVKSVDLFENYGIGGNGPGDNATYGVDEWSWA